MSLWKPWVELVILLFILGPLAAADFKILLLHTADVHARLLQSDGNWRMCEDDSRADCYGGFARLKYASEQKIQEAAARGMPTVFLDAGDMFQGTPFYTFHKWKIIAEFMNMLKIDAMTLGNHDFCDHVDGIIPFINNVTFPIVTANLNTSLEPLLNLTNLVPSVVLDYNGTKVGIIGYLTPETEIYNNPGRVQIMDEIPCIRAEARKLLDEGVNILIALGHSNYTKDIQVATKVEEIDFVVGGHSATFLYSGTLPDSEVPVGPYPTIAIQPSGKKVPVVHGYILSKYLGYIELSFDDSGNLLEWEGQPILLNGSIPQDPILLQALKPYKEDVYQRMRRVLGYTRVTLDSDHMQCKLRECNIGNLITDAFVDHVVRHFGVSYGWTMASIGLIHAGEIGASITRDDSTHGNGSLTIEDLYYLLMPLPVSTVVVVNVTGEKLLDALEHSVARYEDAAATDVKEFLQVSGVKVVYDVGQVSGSRVESVQVLCAACEVPEYQPLDRGKTYGVVLPQFLSGGGEGFHSLLSYDKVVLEPISYLLLAEYIETHGTVYPAVENRIVIRNSSENNSALSGSTIITTDDPLVLGLFLLFVFLNTVL